MANKKQKDFKDTDVVLFGRKILIITEDDIYEQKEKFKKVKKVKE